MKNKNFQHVILLEKRGKLQVKRPLKKGFFLTELMASLVALAAFWVLFARYQAHVSTMNQEAHDCLHAVTLARTALERTRDMQQEERRSGRFLVTVQAHYFNGNDWIALQRLNNPRARNLKRYVATVSWQGSNGKRKEFVLNSVCPGPLTTKEKP